MMCWKVNVGDLKKTIFLAPLHYSIKYVQTRNLLLDCRLSSPGRQPVICLDECQVFCSNVSHLAFETRRGTSSSFSSYKKWALDILLVKNIWLIKNLRCLTTFSVGLGSEKAMGPTLGIGWWQLLSPGLWSEQCLMWRLMKFIYSKSPTCIISSSISPSAGFWCPLRLWARNH